MGGGGGPTKTFTLERVDGREVPVQGDEVAGFARVDQSNTFLVNSMRSTTNAAFPLTQAAENTDPADTWPDAQVAVGDGPTMNGNAAPAGINRVGVRKWDMSADGTQHIFGLENNAGVVLSRVGGTDLANTEDPTTLNANEQTGDPVLVNVEMGSNVAIHPDGSVAFAVGDFNNLPVTANNQFLPFTKYNLSATGVPQATTAQHIQGDDPFRGQGTSLDVGGDFLVSGPGPQSSGDAEFVTQLYNINAPGWETDGVDGIRGASFNFAAGEAGDGACVRITDDGEHLLYTNAVNGSFKILKTSAAAFPAPGSVMEVVSEVTVDIPEDVTAVGEFGDITNIDDDNILVVLSSQDNSAGETGTRLIAYAGRPNNLSLIHNSRWEQDDQAIGAISDIRITKAAVNSALTDPTIKAPQPEEQVLVTVSGNLNDATLPTNVVTYNLNN